MLKELPIESHFLTPVRRKKTGNRLHTVIKRRWGPTFFLFEYILW